MPGNLLSFEQIEDYGRLLGIDLEPVVLKYAGEMQPDYGEQGQTAHVNQDIELLDQLIFTHQCRVPFQTVSVHRGGQAPDLDLDTLFKKIVVRREGGYCFELNKLFEALLKSIGFDVRPILSRAVRGREERMPINHRAILIETPVGLRFADVGFGGPCPAGSILLKDGLTQNIQGEEFTPYQVNEGHWSIDRLTRSSNDFFDDEKPVQRQTELELYTIEVEDIDFESLNLSASSPGTKFREHDMVNLRRQDGHRSLFDNVLTLRKGGSKQVFELSNDQELSEALEEYFGISAGLIDLA